MPEVFDSSITGYVIIQVVFMVGSWYGIVRSSKAHADFTVQVLMSRLDKLERQVEKHNHFGDRLARVEAILNNGPRSF